MFSFSFQLPNICHDLASLRFEMLNNMQANEYASVGIDMDTWKMKS